MTVRRHAEILVPCDIRAASAIIRTLFAMNATYRLIGERDDGTIFIATAKSHWWLLGTAMTVELSPHGPETKVAADITSQSWIMGDAFGMYPRYISEFMAAIAHASALGPFHQR